ncbi:DUF3108 domain-containing protein [Sphingobacterium corticibacter]|uniref:DUF3108 domain-containing protein n=1 Tax=Sphingobacterium corticibacter TaxID=2171749 RepID=A0A2T8HFE8_9SPHI|nr:DUF3108 domain-containing protein [Sphingobacterium corticibacter]PVH24134.1 DUF3108 domain-containing protein [Sphingobacterium corticibacter]
MRKTLATFVLTCLIASLSIAQQLPYLPESTFQGGEKLRYKLKYGILSAASAYLQVSDSNLKFGPDPTFRLFASGATSGAFSLYTVKNKYESYINKRTYLPYLYVENIQEGSYSREEYASFDHKNHTVTGKKGTFKSNEPQFFDLVSAYYFARNLDFSKLKKGDKFALNYFLSSGISELSVEYIGVEKIKTSLGTLECIKLSPEISPGRIFKKDSKLYLWVTNDGNRIPVKAHVEILIGSVTLELVSAEGLKYKLGQRASYSK